MPDSPSLPADPPRAKTEAGPVDTSERLTLLDALRGFALCGVFVSNCFGWFSGRALLSREQALALAAPLQETVVASLYQFFVNQKFVTIFSFLFGLGFSIQLARAESRGTSLVPLYARRLSVLLAMGLVHLFGLWMGDVLSTYAVVGFVLLLFRQRSNKTVLTWALVLMVLMTLVVPLAQRFIPILTLGAQAALEASRAAQVKDAAHRAGFLAELASDSFRVTQAANARFAASNFLGPVRLVWMGVVLANFLFGLLAGRLRLMQDVAAHRGLHLKLLRWGLVVGGVCNGATVTLMRLRSLGVIDPDVARWTSLTPFMMEAGFLGFAAAYVASFALLFERETWRRILGVLAPVGRMALTNYLMQTVMGLVLYDGWGLGLVGKTPPALCVALALGGFALQVPFSHLWLQHFRFGPAEWLWRSLTYGRMQPMRVKAPAEVSVAT
ncbi:DUF418 domain-containing protein [Corallococcus sp. H22C18031201]|uniref:DUF418 domain-containing protein n=1 Tax=Citreicoccus inhibens TaxID=2849499 RepID=UPI000E71698A|nr:DUF418 domain-containing protein [Citreicoccus inhibens]MBU8895258.1 DUF418 domain-containing protein [Citreicoccus inhibens]RJS26158.1 DUF418 domain-containing protein [Corallococcus sp. H22C18031201]